MVLKHYCWAFAHYITYTFTTRTLQNDSIHILYHPCLHLSIISIFLFPFPYFLLIFISFIFSSISFSSIFLAHLIHLTFICISPSPFFLLLSVLLIRLSIIISSFIFLSDLTPLLLYGYLLIIGSLNKTSIISLILVIFLFTTSPSINHFPISQSTLKYHWSCLWLSTLYTWHILQIWTVRPVQYTGWFGVH